MEALVNRNEWLNERRKSLGGSDAAAILNLNKYCTPYTVWADKTGRLPEREDNEAMRQGRDLEDYVARRFCEHEGKKVRRHNQIVRNPMYPFAHANVDRMVVGEPAGLECKTTSVLNLKRFKDGEYPAEYYCQCVHYMAVTGAKMWYLAVLVLNTALMVFKIVRNEDEINALMDSERDFWTSYVEPDTPPPLDGLVPTSKAIDSIFKNASGGEVDIFDIHSVVELRQSLKAQIKALERQLEEAEQTIKQKMGTNETGYCGDYAVKWVNQSRSTLNEGLLLAKYPELDLSNCKKVSHFRKFDIKEAK